MDAERLAESFLDFCITTGVELYDWQREAFGEATRRENGRFVYRVGGVSVPRGDGKTFGVSKIGEWGISRRPEAHVLSAALGLEGTQVTLDYARRSLRDNLNFEIRADSIIVPATGSRWTITSREHTSSRGQHPDIVLYDEVGWARDDELFASLLSAQASVEDPLMIVISTVGRRKSGPLWTVKALAEGGDPAVYWYWHGENRSPRVTKDFLARQKRILMPAQYAREHQNVWVDGADAFASSEDVDAAMGQGWTEQHRGEPGKNYESYVDIGTVHDPTVIGIGHPEGAVVYIDRLVTLQGSRERPVAMAAIEATLLELAAQFPLRRIRVESWQGVAVAQSLERAGLPVEIFTPTVKSNAAEWPVLAQRLQNRELVLFPHARLREELLNLVYEVTEQGVRVIDRGSIHQDHAVVVRGIAASLNQDKGFPRIWNLTVDHTAAPEVKELTEEEVHAAEQRERVEVWNRPSAWRGWGG
jgi:hypothetical protein